MTAPLRVLVIASHPLDRVPGQRFRFEQWLRLLPPGAVEVDLRPLFPAGVYERLYRPGHVSRKVFDTLAGAARRIGDLARAGRYDVAVLYREAFPLGPPVIESLLEARVPVVFDFDDAIFFGDTSPANKMVARLQFPQRVGRIINGAAVTTVGNPWLAEYARRHSSSVEVVPSTIDLNEYRFIDRPVAKRMTVGWSGSHTTSAHLRTIEPALRRMLKELRVRLLVIGDPAFSLPGADHVTVRPWRAATELEELHRIDVGLMPLPDDDWSKGKCGFKALQYMATGAVPVVSPVGVNPDIVRHEYNGLVADSQDEWFAAIATLQCDFDKRSAYARKARRTVEDRYSGETWAPVFFEILERAAAKR